MKYSVEFERCVDFLARMIEKYGNEVELPNTTHIDKNTEDATSDSDDRRLKYPLFSECA